MNAFLAHSYMVKALSGFLCKEKSCIQGTHH